jgi:ATP-dependent Lon protease
MRKESLVGEVGKHIEVVGNVTIRDERAIKKIMSAFTKILFPNLQFYNRELKIVAEFAAEMRQRVRDWLHKLSPGEFPKETLSIIVRS